MPQSPPHLLRLTGQRQRTPHSFALAPDAAAREALANTLGLAGLRKLRFAGSVAPVGGQDWQLEACLGATVVQPCGVSLAPVTTRIDEAVMRLYCADLPAPTAAETEMPDEDWAEPLPETLDLMAVLTEALSLAVPAYPRSPEAAPLKTASAPPGVTPMTDADTRPFAALKVLKTKLQDEN